MFFLFLHRIFVDIKLKVSFFASSKKSSFQKLSNDCTWALMLGEVLFINMTKVPTLPSFALKALEIISASKQKLYIRNQKELKLGAT